MRPRNLVFVLIALATPMLALEGCSGWDPNQPFERESPEVKKATSVYDAGDARAAATILEDYLGTGPCSAGAIGTPESLTGKREGTFDLGLALFAIAETYGERFGSAPPTTGSLGKGPSPENADPKARGEMVTCALHIVQAVHEAPQAGFLLRAKAFYLEGNLHFLSGDYAQAIKAYERALVLVPGEPAPATAKQTDGGGAASADALESVGRDAAWNRAVAMRRLEDSKDAGPDASSDGGDAGDGGDGGDAGKDGGKDGGGDGKDAGKDGGKDGGDGKDGGRDSGSNGGKDGKDAGGEGQDASPPEPDEPDAGGGSNQDQQGSPPPEKTENATPDERILNDLERAPMLQHELSRRAAAARKVRGSADK